jgi:outer membrane protein TolC
VLAVLSLPAALAAQDVAEITLAEALRAAQRDPPAVLVAYAQYRSAQADRGSAQAAWLPALTAQGSAGYIYDQRQPLPTLPRVATASLEARGALALEWVAVDIARGERIDAAAASESARRSDVDATRAQAALLAAELYVRAGAAIELVQDASLSLERRRDQHRAATELVKAGTRSPLDAQRAQVEVLSAEYALALRNTDEQAAFAALGASLGRRADALVRPATTSADFPVSATTARSCVRRPRTCARRSARTTRRSVRAGPRSDLRRTVPPPT